MMWVRSVVAQSSLGRGEDRGCTGPAAMCPGIGAKSKPGVWITRKRANGDTEWIPRPQLDYGQPRTNTYHPERLLCDKDNP